MSMERDGSLRGRRGLTSLEGGSSYLPHPEISTLVSIPTAISYSTSQFAFHNFTDCSPVCVLTRQRGLRCLHDLTHIFHRGCAGFTYCGRDGCLNLLA